MKKTIICVIFGAAVFIGLYNFNVLSNVYIALGLSLLAYIAMNLILSENTNDTSLSLEGLENAEAIVEKCSLFVRKISKTSSHIEDKDLTRNVDSCCATLTKILDYVKNNPAQAKELRKFMQFYLPMFHKILVQYDEIENQDLTSDESRELMVKTGEIVVKLKGAFEKKLNDLNSGKVMDADAEISVMETMLQNDGLSEIAELNILKKKGEQ